MLVFVALGLQLGGQSSSFYADAMVNAEDPKHRSYASEKVDSLFAIRIQQ